MRKLLVIALASAAVAATYAAVTAKRAHGRSARGTIVDTSFRSHALDARVHFLVYLPPGYATSALRYPVVYFLHGLPAGPTSYRTVAWVFGALERAQLRASSRRTSPGRNAVDVGTDLDNYLANVESFVPRLAAQFRRFPTFFAFYVGDRDPVFVEPNVRLHAELRAARVPHVFALYHGAHDTALWQSHAAAWLRTALRHLARPMR